MIGTSANYKENMQNVFDALVDMNLPKRRRETIAGMIYEAYISGSFAAVSDDIGYQEDVYWMAQQASK